MFFLLINWVGQDYYSPQAVAYVLYLGLIGVMLRRMPRRAMIWPFVVIVAAIAVSHQITPMMMLLAVFALIALRRTKGWYLPLVAGAITAGWALTGALDYTLPNLMDLVSEFGNVVGNADQTLEKSSGQTSQADLQVVWGGRFTVAVSVLASLIGVWRHRTTGGLLLTATTLMVLPGVLVLTTGFGGEVLFRAFLFAAPFIAILAAQACMPRDGRGFPVREPGGGRRHHGHGHPGVPARVLREGTRELLHPQEVEASRWVYTHAAPGSLLVEGSTNYPGRFIDYDKFTYVPLDREPEDSTAEMLADPAAKLARWFADPKYADAYVLITRGQKLAGRQRRGHAARAAWTGSRSRCANPRTSRSSSRRATRSFSRHRTRERRNQPPAVAADRGRRGGRGIALAAHRRGGLGAHGLRRGVLPA